MVSYSPRLKLVFAVVVFSAVLVLTGTVADAGQCRQKCCLDLEKPDCPERYHSLGPSEDVYSPGETVEITLSGLAGEDKYVMEEMEIMKVGTDREVVYTEVINATVSEGATNWTWQWNQVGNSGEQVDTDHYFALVETQCCGIYRTDFRIQRQVKPLCERASTCGGCRLGWSASLETSCNRYEKGEEVSFNFSNCSDCEVVFESLAVKRSSGCCGGTETVYYREFEDDYSPGKSWNWSWDQVGDDGGVVQPGSYTMVIDTQSCDDLRTEFRIYDSSDCCGRSSRCGSCGSSGRCGSSGFGLFSLFTCCGCN